MNEKTLRSPRIMHRAWGEIQVEGFPPFRDAKLWPGGARAWNWDETGTRHSPGIQPADVEELLEHGARVVVLSTGVYGRLRVRPETLRMLEEKGVRTHVLRTPEAERLYNELCASEAVGALIHTTC
ncbi:MAG: hypothetical protein D6775_01540 [Caldilineae bacterium]|nr:MAG: hypothetical protein D6775_01540 [Caldilineae bacterium]